MPIHLTLKKYKFAHNFRLNDATDFIFAPQHNIIKRNISWNFDQNLIRWRHFMRSHIPPLPMGGVAPHFQVAAARMRAADVNFFFAKIFIRGNKSHI